MRFLHAICLLTFLPAVGCAVNDPETERVERLVGDLGAKRFTTREAAMEELWKIGENAIPPLQAAANGRDLDLSKRANETIRRILLSIRKAKPSGMEMAPVLAGKDMIGSAVGEVGRRGDETRHEVRITQPFLLGAYEVTQEEYLKVMKVNPSYYQSAGGGKGKVAGVDTSRFPVESVSWFDAIEFCNRLSKVDGYEPYYALADAVEELSSIKRANVSIVGGNGYRLPTEAEWEFACRAGSPFDFHFGRETKNGYLNCKPLMVASGYGTAPKWPEVGRTAKVGSYPPNERGLHDMHGNVAEWCWDWYAMDYEGQPPRVDPHGPEKGTHRVMRGGSWMVNETSCRSACRFFHAPDERIDYAGFRVARTPGPAKKK